MSSAATKCQVGRITCVRMISPSVNARSISASVGAPAIRSASDHLTSANSWAWTAPDQRTASTTDPSGSPASRWLAWRRRIVASGSNPLGAGRVADQLGVDRGGALGDVGPVEAQHVLGALGDEPVAQRRRR